MEKKKLLAKIYKKGNLSPINIFVWVSLFSLLSVGLALFFSKGKLFSYIFFKDALDSGMDFFHSIEYTVGRSPYELFGTLYPPLANLFFYIILQFVPQWEIDQWGSTFSEGVAFRGTSADLRVWQPTFLIFLFFIVACVVCFLGFVQRTLPTERNKMIIGCCLLSTHGVLYAFERGNIIIVSALCVALFIENRNADSAFRREAALISLAVAAGLKLYPALFGFLLLYDKEYKKAFRTIIYGMIAFFAPFLFFKEGLGGITIFLRSLTSFSQGASLSTGYSITGQGTSVDRIVSTFIIFFETIFHIEIDTSFFMKIAPSLNITVACLILLMGFWMEKEWERVLACALALTLYQTQGFYILVFILIAFIFFLRDEEKIETKNIIPFIGMVGINILVPLPQYRSGNLTSAQYLKIQFCLLALIGWFIWKFLSTKQETVSGNGRNRRCIFDKTFFGALGKKKDLSS